MRPLGSCKTRYHHPGHQHCGICHPHKPSRAKEKREVERQAERDAAPQVLTRRETEVNLIVPAYSIMHIFPEGDYTTQWFELIGRICYKSEDKITPESAPKFLRGLLKVDRMVKLENRFKELLELHVGILLLPENEDSITLTAESMILAVQDMMDDPAHESVIEHSMMTVRFIFDRGVSHEMVRHRLCALTQESTRYCNYGKGGEVNVIVPNFWVEDEHHYKAELWEQAMKFAERIYLDLIAAGAKPEEARSVLPNSLKTEIAVTANFREWRHIFRLRTSKRAHPQMREVMCPLLKEARTRVPIIFDDVGRVYA